MPEFDRRDFLKILAAGSDVFGPELSAQESGSQNYSSYIEEYSAHYLRTLELESRPEISPRVQELISLFVNWQNDYFERYLNTDAPRQKILAFKKKLFDSIKKYMPTLGEFSPENYDRMFAYEMPKFLGDNGVYAGVLHVDWQPNDKNLKRYNDNIVNFFRIKSVSHKRVNYWGEDLDIPVVEIDENLLGKAPVPPEKEPVFTDGGNAIYFSGIFEKRLAESREADSSTKDLSNYSDEFIFNAIKQNSSGPEAKIAASVAFAKCKSKIKNQDVSADRIEQSAITHESGHIYALKNGLNLQPNIADKKDPASITNFRIKASFRSEAVAMLTELRYSEFRASALSNLLSEMLVQNTASDASDKHTLAYEWVLEKMVSLVLVKPESYGMKIDRNSNISPESQIIMQMADLIDRPTQLNSLAEQVFTIFKKEIDYTMKLPTTHLFREPVKYERLAKDIAPYAIGTGAVGAGAYWYRRHSARRKLVKMEAFLENNLKGKTGDKRELIDSLQLGIGPKELNESRRNLALAKLERQSQANPRIKSLVDEIKRILKIQ